MPGFATRTSSCNKLRASFVLPFQRRLVDLNLLGNPVKILHKIGELVKFNYFSTVCALTVSKMNSVVITY